MTTNEAKTMVGQVVKTDCGIWGVIEYVTAGWAGIRGPHNRLDEIQVARISADPT